MQLILVGNYGVGNLGDEALKDFFLDTFPHVDWKVVSANPEKAELHRLPLGIRSFFSFSWIQTLKTIKHSEGMVFGGGSLFTDSESVFACLLWGLHAAVARLYKKPIYLAFQGIGPCRNRLAQWITKRVLSWSKCTIVRDVASASRITQWDTRYNVVTSFDPVITQCETIRKECDEDVLVVIPRKNSGQDFIDRVLHCCCEEHFDNIIIISMEPGNLGEQRICARLQSALPLSSIVVGVSSFQELQQSMALAKHVIAHRFHGALAALASDIPMTIVSQVDGDKLSQLENSKRTDLQRLVAEGIDALLPYTR